MEQNIIAVSQVNEYIKFLLDRDELLGNICVRGELSNYKVYPSGHHYFTLKDAEGALRCVMFRSSAQRLRFRPENGMQVIASGRVTVFPRDGAYQLYCNTLTADGAGDLYVAFEQLKEKLAKEGLFDPAHKKPIPKYPHTIAIITSGAIRYANRYQVADLIITGRGGGSMEDLWAFNDERVARAIYDSEIPVISAVGHEPDVTIADYVADLRAATPSNAAELAVPDRQELQKKLQMMQASMQQSVQKSVKLGRQRLSALAEKRVLQSPLNYLEDRRVLLDFLSTRLQAAEQKTLHESKQRFVRLTAALDAMSPLKVLSRGYSMVTNEAGAVISRAADVRENETIRVSFSSGSLTARVEQIQEDAT